MPLPARTELSLATLVNEAGLGLLDVLVAPLGLDLAVARVIVAGATEPVPLQSGDLVLLLGTRPDAAQLQPLLDLAVRAQAAGVVMRSAGAASDAICAAAQAAGIALLCVRSEISWDRLYAIVDTAIASPPGLPEEGGVPLGDLFALADAVSALVGGPVTIEDVHSRVLAYSSALGPLDEPRQQSILTRRTPERWVRKFRAAGVYHKFLTSDEVVRIEEFASEGLRPRLAVAIRAGGEVLGSIWVAEGDEPLGPTSAAALSEAGRMAALHMVRQRAVEEVERLGRSEVLRALFDGTTPAAVLAGRLGIDPGLRIAVFTLEPMPGHENELPPVREALVDMAGLSAEAFHRHSCCVMTANAVHLLIPVADEHADLRALATEVVERAESALRVTLLCGIGGTKDHLSHAPASRREADRTVAVLRSDPRGTRVAHIEDVRSHTALAQLRQLVREWEPPHAYGLRQLSEYDLAGQPGEDLAADGGDHERNPLIRAPPSAARRWRGRSPQPGRRRRGPAPAARPAKAACRPCAGPGPWRRIRSRRPPA
ncbi:MAG: hypothetical protein QOD13_3091 [Thermoleophilaceae bacterium]|nr:hypothetical protein [Thermoleophilaceae bacterium]